MARARLAHIPALDGLRGVAVGAVICYHGGLSEVPGGFLGVSTFFTLSGFLITSLLLIEHSNSGSLDLGAFWARRARRLLPGAIAGLAFGVATSAAIANPVALMHLPGEVTSASVYVGNWWILHADVAYADRLFAPSVVRHYWSLAIEEQFYLLLPLVVLGALGRRRRAARPQRLAALAGLFLVGMLASVLVTVTSHGGGLDNDRAYLGTDARAAELLVGCLLAIVLLPSITDRTRAQDDGGSKRLATLIAVGGVAGAAGIAVLWHGAALNDEWLYEGGLILHAALSAAVIAACTRPGPVRALLSARPLRWLGRHSYGVYLYHWPVFVFLNQSRVDWTIGPLFAVRIGITLVLSMVSLRILEEPIRVGRSPLAGKAGIPAAALAGALVIAAAFAVRAAGPDPSGGQIMTNSAVSSRSVLSGDPGGTAAPTR